MSDRAHASRHRLVRAVLDAAEGYNLVESPAWDDLDALSSRTSIDAIEVDPAGVTVKGRKFDGISTVYVGLSYGNGGDGFETSDNFLGRFRGHFDDDVAVIDEFQVDTSPFYEGADRLIEVGE